MLRNPVPIHYGMMSWGSGGEAPRILDQSIILTLVDRFTSERESPVLNVWEAVWASEKFSFGGE